MEEKRQLTIHFVDGSKISYQYPTQFAPEQITKQVSSMLQNQYLIIEADGAISLYPLSSVKSIQVFPAPAVLPKNILKGATIV